MVYKKNNKRPSKFLYKKKYSISTGKLKDKKINTLVEKRMKEIAIQEDNKRKEKLVYRQFLLGQYDRDTNIFGGGSNITWGGIIMPVAPIQKTDNSTAVTVAPAANAEQTPTTYVNPGANVIAPVTGQNGFRIGDFVYIYGISLTYVIEQPRFLDADITRVPDYSYADIHLAIVKCIYPGSEAVASEPDAMEVLKVPIYGFDKKLDIEFAQDNLGLNIKKKTIWKVKHRMKIAINKTNIIERSVYIDLKDKPLQVSYDKLDQNGQEVIGFKPFFALRSTIPSHADYTAYRPKVRAVMKVYYNNEK